MTLLKIVGFLLASVVSSQSFAAPSDACLNDIEANLSADGQRLQESYLKLDPTAQISSGNQTRWIRGSDDHAVLILHGFAASPFEVQAIADGLAHSGHSILMPLIPGFGATAKVANRVGLAEWRKSVRRNMQLLARCFREISLIGFSTGGALVSDLLLDRNATSEDGIFSKAKIVGAALLSPYYTTHIGLVAQSSDLASGIRRGPMMKTLYYVSGQTDAKVFVLYPSYYLDRMAFGAANQVVKLGSELLKISGEIKSRVPTLLAYSEFDQTISQSVAAKFVPTHFSQNQSFIISKSERVPHQIAIPALNPQFSNLLNAIRATIDPVNTAH